MGLRYADLSAWRRWQRRRHPLRAVRGRLRPVRTAGVLTRGSAEADLLVVLDGLSPSNRAALLAPVAALAPERVAVLSPVPVVDLLPEHGWSEQRWGDGEPLGPVSAVLTAGHYLALGAVGHAEARRRDVPELVVQHGLLTPLAPPLPPGATLLAWSAADADFWGAERAEIVGSQLLHDAAAHPAPATASSPPLTYLGQLHGAELPRRDLAAAAEAFCAAHGATYRPHPAERDRASRRTHARWEASGMTLDRSDEPLSALTGGVVSVFSTGVLEAAARGLPAWVDLPTPPAWLEEFWDRYAMRPWGSDPTPAPARPAVEPARAVAAALEAIG
ncbi:prephenate dehydrogenase [Marmoricola endophyticus]|uniref:prephenate dehydrogenase n=1 Tax=Marmoricola endophyticus TaxID=2040280 RepID=UPI001E58FC6F|nr:prephenate dehydrogenase [Marmoricola endophyticus]